MTHLFVCREYPPASYPPGGIGTYARQMTDLLARAGETVHVIAHRWDGAPQVREETIGGRLIVHRVALDEQTGDDGWASFRRQRGELVPRALLASSFPSQAFSWQAALLAERLVESEGIDVIEAQEWEAPLYYFQLRRALNLGPATRPPCVIHIHSPSEQIFAANGWDTTVSDYLPAAQLEEYSIVTADALLCPSHFVAEQALARYRFDPSRMHVIPYPLGDAPHLDRTADTWSTGSICHVGRLELRKGVLEWGDAVSLIAADYPRFLMEFVGGDTPLHAAGGPTVGHTIRARIPRRIRRQFRFHGTRDHAGVNEVLSGACAAVVPSRWENFPYSCIESMCSGLPVIASPNGGMRELVEDGISGWIADRSSAAGLAGALKRALETPGPERERMGRAAEAAVRRTCDNERVIRQHLDLKAQLGRGHATRSLEGTSRRLGMAAGSQDTAVEKQATAAAGARRDIGVIATGPFDEPIVEAWLSGIRAQEVPPAAVYVVCDSDPPSITSADVGWHIVRRARMSADEAEMSAAQRMILNDPSLLGVAFIDVRVRLDPGFLATCAKVFSLHDRIGIVSAWTHETRPLDRVRIQPCPAVPYIWHDGHVSPYVAVRAEAYAGATQKLRDVARPYTRRDVFDQVMGSGWGAVTYPSVLGSIALDPDDPAARPSVTRYSSMAQAIQRLHTPIFRWLLSCPAEERRAFVRQGIRSPARSARWLVTRTVRAWRGSSAIESLPVAPAAPRIESSEPLTSSAERSVPRFGPQNSGDVDRPDATR